MQNGHHFQHNYHLILRMAHHSPVLVVPRHNPAQFEHKNSLLTPTTESLAELSRNIMNQNHEATSRDSNLDLS